MTAGEPVAPPLYFRGKQPTGGGAGTLSPSPTFPAAMPPRAGGIGRERYLQNPWKGGIPVVWRMHLGVTDGGRKGRGRGIGPLTRASRRHTAPRRGNRQGKVFEKPMERRDPSGLTNASWGHTRGPPGAGTRYLSLSRYFPPRPYGPASGEQAGKVFAKSMERRDPSGLANAFWGHTRGPQGAGAGHWPLNLGFPPPQRRSANKVIGGRSPSHGAGGHLMHGARGAEKGGEGQDESRREQEGEPQLPFPLADAGVRRLCTQARLNPAPSGWTGRSPAG